MADDPDWLKEVHVPDIQDGESYIVAYDRKRRGLNQANARIRNSREWNAEQRKRIGGQ